MKVIFHPEAQEEMIESARIYEAKSEGLGSDFLTAVEETTQSIEGFPEAGLVDRGNIRKRLIAGFPFTILYETNPERIFIAAVMHQHRRPGYWRKRFEQV
jgi:plasmid stabilization system protein ParE